MLYRETCHRDETLGRLAWFRAADGTVEPFLRDRCGRKFPSTEESHPARPELRLPVVRRPVEFGKSTRPRAAGRQQATRQRASARLQERFESERDCVAPP